MNMHNPKRISTHLASGNPIAIIGMAGRFPGAASVDEFWDNLRNGVDSISRFEDGELEDAFTAQERACMDFVPARAILDAVDLFDADFFGMYPREAALTDPQHRVFLECAWEALESAGYDPVAYPGAIGVFAGCSMNTYFLNNVCADRATIEAFTSNFQVGNYPMLVGAGQDFLATRVAYKLDLRGPAVTLGTACSTSLTAVVQACQSLHLRQSDMVLAGGASITFPQKRGYMHQQGGMVSRDGRCCPFDADASGTVFGSGAAAVLLKRLDDALADGDRIHAVIRSAAVNNDGSRKVGFTAPSIHGQADVVATAHAFAGVEARSIGFIECHGTATPLGDPIEFTALVKAFSATTDEQGFCALGSVKANVGHLDAAAGVTGLIKAALAVRDGVIPPLVNFNRPSPFLDLEHSPFYINTTLQPWTAPVGMPRRGGVTALGVGGTNVHVVIEEAPGAADTAGSEARRPAIILPVSARTEGALVRSKAALAAHLETHACLSMSDVGHTLQQGRRAFDHRDAIVCHDRLDAIAQLRRQVPSGGRAKGSAIPPIVFMVPGQGAQYLGMGRGLYEREPVFRDIMDIGANILQPSLGRDLRALIYDESQADGDADGTLRSTIFAQPALFLTAYATARLWMSWGVEPAAMVGHSVGELVCATLADVFSLKDALGLIAARGRLMQDCRPGAMLAVRLSEAELSGLLREDIDIAAVNGPRSCVASGTYQAVHALEQVLTGLNVMHRRLQTSHAFHSAMMDPVAATLTSHIETLSLRQPQIPFVSGVSGKWIDPDEAVSALYWARHCRDCVRFSDAVATVASEATPILLEVGAGRTLGDLAAHSLQKGAIRDIVASLRDASTESDDHGTILTALGRLWVAGVKPLWNEVNGGRHRRVPLPTYPFERESHWIAAPKPGTREKAVTSLEEGRGHRIPHVLPKSIAIGTDMFVPPLPVASTAPIPPVSRLSEIRAKIASMLEDLSGERIKDGGAETTFLELGFDSLFLAQLAARVQKIFGVAVTFRQLLGDLSSIAALADHLDRQTPRAAMPVAPAPIAELGSQPTAGASTLSAPVMDRLDGAGHAGLHSLFQQQLTTMQSLFAQQFQALNGSVPGLSVLGPLPVPPSATGSLAARSAPLPPVAEATSASRLHAYRAGASDAAPATTPAQQSFINDLTARYNARTPGSKRGTQDARGVLADPRAAAGFRREWKELVYPILCARSKGSKIWDVDGNEYVDLVNGYGQTAFGHAPDFVVSAIAEQMEQGFPIGPQSPLAGEVAGMISRMTGNERVTFCNTGSEAIMAAMRVARTVTGRDRVVVFAGAYHGQFDEVLVKTFGRSTSPGALPAAPGIPDTSVTNMVVLPYGTPESLEWIRTNSGSLAAVIVEPVQSRRPAFLPHVFIQELRTITEISGCALVFDEVVTGFRVQAGGMQAALGINADLVTYGKVVGGGMPIGILAGKARFMDALDGGQWRYGDKSLPEIAPTFFAGTFVRHPLALAAARAVLRHIEAKGPALQRELASRTAGLVDRLNAKLERNGIATRAEAFSSWFYLNFGNEDRLAGLFFHHARLLGVHVQEGFPCFLTTEHSARDIDHILDVFTKSLDALQAVGILSSGPRLPLEAIPREVVIEEPLPDVVPWTEPQKEIWLAAQLGNHASCAFNESVSLEFTGDLDVNALAEALDDVVARHDSLRASFGRDGERMHVASESAIELPYVDFSDSGDAQKALASLLASDACRPFDLAEGPLVRATLARCTEARHVLVLTAHHIICDGWSMNVILNEIMACYAARRQGGSADLPAVPSFRLHAVDMAKPDGGNRRAEAFWLKEYATLPAPLDLPSDRPRPPRKSFRGATFSDAIGADLLRTAKAAGARQGCTLFVTLLSTLQILVGRLAGHDDVVIAVPTAGQNLAGLDGLVGHCVNLLPVRSHLHLDSSAGEHLKTTKRSVLEAYEHQEYTYGTLVHRLGVPRDQSRLPLTQIQFNLEKLVAGPQPEGLTVKAVPNGKAFSNFDLFINFVELADGIRIDCDYSTDLFDETTIARWMGHFRTLLAAIAGDALVPLSALPLLSIEEQDWLLRTLNDTAAGDLDQRPVQDLVSAQASRTPDAVAVMWRDLAVSYGELDKRANRLARHIGAIVPGAGGRIALGVSRSPDLLVGLLAILKAGHAYVPFDTQQPAARLRTILEDAQIAALLCDSLDVAANLTYVPVIELATDRDEILSHSDAPLPRSPANGAEGTAYVIFTSGSTGKPKGVEVAHHSLTNLLWSMARKPGFTSADTLLAVTTISFDIAAAELLLPLATGGRVVIADRAEVTDGFRLVERIGTSQATVVQATPSLWRMLLEAGFRSRPGFAMLCGGEPLSRDLADRLLEGGGALWNLYGPTETTIWSSAGEVLPGSDLVTIGTPLLNTQIHVLDAINQIVPIGVAGELFIGGAGLAKGYLGRADLTAQSFRNVSLPGHEQRRLYRTGDRAKRLADGAIQLMGRADTQVKLRGFRIELEEIEAVVRACPGVAAVAVSLSNVGSEPRLVAYFVPAGDISLEPASLKNHAAARLPDYMVPTLWMSLDALPLTPNRKLDRSALPVATAAPAHRTVLPPETPLQAQLVRIFSDALQVPDVGIDDNLFALGGDSIHVFRIASRMREQGFALEAANVMQCPTVRTLADAAATPRATSDEAAAPSLQSFRRTARPLGATTR